VIIIVREKSIKKGGPGKLQELTPVQELWRIGYVLLCGILLLITVYMLFSVISSPGTGWDYRVYMGAVDALNQNKDPYILDNIKEYVGDDLPFVYPPHTFILFEFLFLFQSIGVYRLFFAILILISAYLVWQIDEKHHYLFFITLLLTGFISIYWNFLTANDSIVFLFFTSVIFYCLKKGRITESAIATGLMASFSLFPILFSAIFLLIRQTLVERLKLICIAGGTLGAILVLSYIVNPSLMMSFIHSLVSDTSRIYESGGMSTPTPYLMFGDITKGLGLGSPVFTAILSLLYIGAVLGSTYFFVMKNQGDMFKVYCLGFLAIFMILPRLKPYTFIMLVVPLYFLLKESSYKAKILVFSGISLFPMVVYLNYFINSKLVPDLINLYAQSMSLFFIFAYIILNDLYGSSEPS
jgi:hypothetical protein